MQTGLSSPAARALSVFSVWYWISDGDSSICPPPPPVRTVFIGSETGAPTLLLVFVIVSGARIGRQMPPVCFSIIVLHGSWLSVTCPPPEWLHSTMNGAPDLIVNLSTPRMMRRMVLSASGRTAAMPYRSWISSFVEKIEGHGSDQSIISAALRHGNSLPLRTSALSRGACVRSGQTISRPSQRAISTSRRLVVGAP